MNDFKKKSLSFFIAANGKKEYLRKCNFENVDAPKDDCISTKTPKNVENYFCETCNTDGCKFFLTLFSF